VTMGIKSCLSGAHYCEVSLSWPKTGRSSVGSAKTPETGTGCSFSKPLSKGAATIQSMWCFCRPRQRDSACASPPRQLVSVLCARLHCGKRLSAHCASAQHERPQVEWPSSAMSVGTPATKGCAVRCYFYDDGLIAMRAVRYPNQ